MFDSNDDERHRDVLNSDDDENELFVCLFVNKQANKHLRCGNRKGLLGRNDQTHHRMGPKTNKTNKQKFKVRQPQRAAKSKRPNAPSDGSKNNGIHTTKQEEYPSRHPTNHQEDLSVSKSNTIQSRRGSKSEFVTAHD